jgi:hypothetical protein
MRGVGKEEQLLQMYLLQGNINKWCIKLFRRLLTATVLNSSVIYRYNVERNVDQLKFRVEMVEGLLMKYSVLCGLSAHQEGDNIV